MKVNFMTDGASRYIVGNVERFDQKNDMFKRAMWDPNQADGAGKFYAPKDYAKLLERNKPGYTLLDAAFENASWLLERGFARGNYGGRSGLLAWEQLEAGRGKLPAGLQLPIDDAAEMTRHVKKVATFFGASTVGVCELDRRWLYSHCYNILDPKHPSHEPLEMPEEYKYVIAIASEMDYESMKSSPTKTGGASTGLGYSDMAFAAGLLAYFIRGLGYKAIPAGNDTACSVPIAIDAGLGELSRMGFLITPEFGPRVRLSKVFTDLPLVPDRPIEFGVWDFCLKCEKCAKDCPSRAIMYGEPTREILSISNREGLLRWPINAEKCLSFWAGNGASCASCIRVCPFNKPPGWTHNAVKWGIKNTRWLDSFFVWADDLLGYGKQAKPGQYWK